MEECSKRTAIVSDKTNEMGDRKYLFRKDVVLSQLIFGVGAGFIFRRYCK
jgi:hypothetical protein